MQLNMLNLYTGELRPTALSKVQAEVGPGWAGIIERLVADLEALGWNGEIHQVKEKFGGLRFYIGSGNDAVHKRVSDAESASYTTCEYCGQPGKERGGGWIKTLCDACHTENGIDNDEAD